MTLVDTHAHLYWESYKEDLDQVIQRVLDAGVGIIINVGVDVEKSQEALRQVQEIKWPSGMTVYSTIGIHPHEAVKYAQPLQNVQDRKQNVQEDIDKLEQIYLSAPKTVVAVGECGLDYLIDRNDIYPDISLPEYEVKDLQRKLFQAQIDLAKKLNLPLIVHCRDDRSKNPKNSEAWNKVLEMVGNHPTILHCYSGLLHTTNSVLRTNNLYVSFAATLTYPKNDYLREATKLIPLDRMIIETDCPFLPPQSKRGTRNEPANIVEIAQLIADLKGIPIEDVANKTTENCSRIFAF